MQFYQFYLPICFPSAGNNTETSKGAISIECYSLRCNSWTSVATIGNKRLQFGVAVLDEKLFIVGGRDGLKTLNTVDCFDPQSKERTAVTPMNIHRHGLGVGVLGGPLYAVGGHDGWSYLNSVERYRVIYSCPGLGILHKQDKLLGSNCSFALYLSNLFLNVIYNVKNFTAFPNAVKLENVCCLIYLRFFSF